MTTQQCELKDIEITESKFEQCGDDLHVHLSFKEVIPKDDFVFDPNRNYLNEMNSKQKLRYYRAAGALNLKGFSISSLWSSINRIYYENIKTRAGLVKIQYIKPEDAHLLDLIEEDILFLQSDLDNKHELLYGHILGLL